MAIQPGKLLVAFSAFAVICLVGWLMDLSQTVVVSPVAQGNISELQVYLNQPERVPLHITGYKITGGHAGVFSTMSSFASSRFQGAVEALLTLNLPTVVTDIADFINALSWSFRYHFIYSISFATIAFIVIAFAGGAICRLAAVQFARGEKAGLIEVLRFSKNNFTSFFAAPLAPLGVAIVAGLVISLLGLIVNIPFAGELIMAITIFPALMGGLIITILLILTIAGFSLMFPAIACDKSDFFDAICKAFIYVFVKPWRMGFYTVIAAVYGAICYIFVRFCTFLLLSTTYLFMQLSILADSSTNETTKLNAIWSEPQFKNLLGYSTAMALNGTESIAAYVVHISLLAVVGLLIAFVISFYFSANTIIYTLLRNKVDSTPLSEVYLGHSDGKTIQENKPQN